MAAGLLVFALDLAVEGGGIVAVRLIPPKSTIETMVGVHFFKKDVLLGLGSAHGVTVALGHGCIV